MSFPQIPLGGSETAGSPVVTGDDICLREGSLLLLKKKTKMARPKSESACGHDSSMTIPSKSRLSTSPLAIGHREILIPKTSSSSSASSIALSTTPTVTSPQKLSTLRQRVSHMRQQSMRAGSRSKGLESLATSNDVNKMAICLNQSIQISKGTSIINDKRQAAINLKNSIPNDEPMTGEKNVISVTSEGHCENGSAMGTTTIPITNSSTSKSVSVSASGVGSATIPKPSRLRLPSNSLTKSDEALSLSLPSASASSSTSEDLRLKMGGKKPSVQQQSQPQQQQQQQQQPSLQLQLQSIDKDNGGVKTRPPRVAGDCLQEKKLKRDRYRAEVYAINAYLRKIEQAKFEALKAEMLSKDTKDDVSWCSDDSSVLPTPRYRSASEKKRTGVSEPTKQETTSVSKAETTSVSKAETTTHHDRFGGV